MQYWVREFGSPPFQGPFTLAEVAAGLKAGTISDTCELLPAEGQSYGALNPATGWRLWHNFDLRDVPETGPRMTPPARAKPRGRYSALQVLAGWFTILAVVNGIAAAIGCIGGMVVLGRDKGSGAAMIITCLIGGAIAVITLLAFAEGIKLAIDVATDLRELRDRMSRDSGEPGTPTDRPGA